VEAQPGPLRHLVSEIMLQQTRVAVVVERYLAFMARFPTLLSLAQAPEQEVLALWSGLGYYRRARMLHKAAQFVAEHYGGNLPKTAEELRSLPASAHIRRQPSPASPMASGWQWWTAMWSGCCAGWRVGRPAAARAAARRSGARSRSWPQSWSLRAAGDSNQALMELGATLCSPRNPQCLVCPVATDCKTQGEHQTAPRRR